MIRFLELLLLPGIAYLLGAIPWGLLVAGAVARVDVRKTGSGNIGATNVRRAAGNGAAVLTLVLDAAKGAVPVLLAAGLVDPAGAAGRVYLSLVALCAVAGHLYPVFLRFRGGKGVATAAGAFLVLSPAALVVSLLVFVMVVCFSDQVSAGSLAAVATLPVAVWESTGSGILTGCAVIAGLWIMARHRKNIARLLSGRESKL